MSVLVGKFGKAEEGFVERGRNKLVGMLKRFFDFADNYGLVIADREVEALKNIRDNKALAIIKNL